MKELKIKRPNDNIERRCYKHLYYIYDGKIKVGEVEMKKTNNYMLIAFIGIYDKYRRNGYGKSTIQLIFDNYKIDGIVGECLIKTCSQRFWNKIIKLFCGKKYTVTHCSNTAWSFVIRQSGEMPESQFVKKCISVIGGI